MRWNRAAGRCLLVLGVVLTGCVSSGEGGRDSAGGGRGPLTLATAGDLTGYLGTVLDGWNRTHPGERVTLVELPDSADETHAQMVTDLRGGDRSRFDVLNIDVNWTSEFAAAGWIRPLDEDRFPLKSFLKPVVETGKYDGRLYAVPYVTN
ncbi:extracellular solute-binding protein, partial [Streptomyces sp. NPDC002265]|uniref:extracellular solute-binding protein n=1 Tax=Streptomyces sp. NPDC002265 TaxID=3154415 RepID=UPI00333294F9